MWKALPITVLWSVWKHRNECLFKDVIPIVDGVCDLIKLRMAVWFKEVFKDHKFTVHDFLFNLKHIRFCLGGGARAVL